MMTAHIQTLGNLFFYDKKDIYKEQLTYSFKTNVMTSTKSPGNSLALEPTGIDMYKTVYRESKFVPVPSIIVMSDT